VKLEISLDEYVQYFKDAVTYAKRVTDHPVPPMKSKVFIVDASWVAYRSFHVFKSLSVSIGEETHHTGIIYGFVRMLLTMKKFDPKAVILLAMDSKPTVNKKRMSEYKEGRDPDRPDVHKEMALCLPFLTAIPGVWIVKEEGAEADDLISFTEMLLRLVFEFKHRLIKKDSNSQD